MSARWYGDGLGDEISDKTALRCADPSLTKQADRDAADINNILKRYEKTGELPNMIKRDPVWGDFADMPTFQEAFEVVAKAEEQFAALDAQVRRRFDNDPALFLAFASDPQNTEEMRSLGLLKTSAGAGVVNPEPASEASKTADKGVGQ